MAYTKAPPQSISAQLRAMKPETDILLRDANLRSVRSLLCRFKGKRVPKYSCAADIGGIRVWRIA